MQTNQGPNILTRRSMLWRAAMAGRGILYDPGFETDQFPDRRRAFPQTTRPSFVSSSRAAMTPTTGSFPRITQPTRQYAATRGNLALPSVVPAPAAYGPEPRGFRLHLSRPHLRFSSRVLESQTLFGEQKLAIVQNVGTLVRPTTKAQYNSGLASYRPPQLFSHSDQVTQWQTSLPDQPPATGWAGRIADIYSSVANPDGHISMSVSLNGANTLQIGNLISQYHVSTAGAVTLSAGGSGGGLMGLTGVRQKAVQSILDLPHANLQRQAYAGVLDNAVFTGDLLNTNIAAYRDPTDSSRRLRAESAQDAAAPWRWNTGLTGIYRYGTPAVDYAGGFPNTTLGIQMKMIARLIVAAGPSGFNMKRQIFFCSLGGFDTHTAQVDGNGFTNQPTDTGGTHYGLLRQASATPCSRSNAPWNSSASPIRSLPSPRRTSRYVSFQTVRAAITAGAVTTSSWAAGSMAGSTASFRHWQSVGRTTLAPGRWIPTLSVDEHTATLAKWYGLTQNDIGAVLPNLSRFSSNFGGNYVGFMKPA